MEEKLNITVCMGSACFARGNAQNLEYIEEFIARNKLNATIELLGSRCEGKCADGPNIIVNGFNYKKVNEKKINTILKQFKNTNED